MRECYNKSERVGALFKHYANDWNHAQLENKKRVRVVFSVASLIIVFVVVISCL